MREYLVPSAEGIAEFTEKRSRFIGRIWPVESEDAALGILKSIREKHWDATHNVYAYIIEGGQTRYSDDGEPQGTAGMPVLDVLRKREVSDVLCIVTRYFGGTLLGAGGLVRAYTQAAALALEAAGLSRKQVWTKLDIPCSYSLFERTKLELLEFQGVIDNIEYGADVVIHSLLSKTVAGDFCARIIDISAGTISPIYMGDEYMAFKLN